MNSPLEHVDPPGDVHHEGNRLRAQHSDTAMKLGLFFDLRNPARWSRPWPHVYGAALELCEEAEQLGADAAWVTEHHDFADGYCPQPLTVLAAMAARTRRIRLGTGIILAALRHPRHLAEEAAIVDVLSDGRLELGIGAGYRREEYEMFGRDFGSRWTLTDNAALTVRELLWSDILDPPAVQTQLPIWMGYQGEQGARRAGRMGMGLLSLRPELLAPYYLGLDEGGHDRSVARLGGVVDIVLADDPERVAAIVAPHYAHQLNTYKRAKTPTGTPFAPLTEHDVLATLTHLSSPGLKVLDPGQASSHIKAITAGLPVAHLYFWASVSAMPEEIVQRHTQLLFSELRRELGREPGGNGPLANDR